MDWRKVYFGHVFASEVKKCVNEPHWQEVRLSMKGKDLDTKYAILCSYLKEQEFSHEAKVRTTNYVTALSRGGLITPDEYR